MSANDSAPFLSQIAIAKETLKGTTPAITTGLRGYFIGDPRINPVQSVIRKPTYQNRHLTNHILSNYHMEGKLLQEVTPNGHIGYWLGMAIGDPTSVQQGSTTAYKHTYTPEDDLSTFSLWYKRGGSQQIVIPYCVVDTLVLSQTPDDILRQSVGIIGQKETINSDDFTTADAYDTVESFHNMDLAVTGPTNALEVHNSTIMLNNNYNVKLGGVHGSRFYKDLIPGDRNVFGSFDLWFNDDGDYQSFWGSSTDTTPDINGAFDTVPLNFKWDSNAEAGTGYNYVLEVDIPEAVYIATKVVIGNRIKQTVEWSAQYDTGDSYEIEAYLTNKVASYP